MRQGGFSLLEALVALAIAAIALGSLYRAVGQTSQTVSSALLRVESGLLAQSLFALGTFAQDIPSGSVEGVAGWRWQFQLGAETIEWAEMGNAGAVVGVPVGRLTLTMTHQGPDATTFTWVAWKPLKPPKAAGP